MIKYRGHEIIMKKYHSNDLYECNKCNLKGWSLDLIGENNPPILTCNKIIIKGILE